MFRKIVTELAYSPALAGNLGLYIKQLRDESSKRQIGLIFMLLAVITQLIALGAPPESANANNPAVFIDEEISSVEQYLEYYDQNTHHIRDLLSSLQITRSDIASAKEVPLQDTESAVEWSMLSSRQEGNTSYSFTLANKKTDIAYFQPIPPSRIDTPVYLGVSQGTGSWFAITRDGATLITEKPPQSTCTDWLAAPNSPLTVGSWMDDKRCLDLLSPSVSAKVISSQGEVPDRYYASDRIAYTLSLENQSDTPMQIVPSMNLEDLLEYSRILDYGGGAYDYDTKNIHWPATSLEAGGTLERTFIIQLLPTIPATARGKFIKASYDCTAAASFGNHLAIPVSCPLPKYIERATHYLPTPPGTLSAASSITLFIVVIFLYLRSKQQLTELYIIRHNHLGNL